MTNNIWTVKLDWLNVISALNLDSIKEVPEDKREKAIKRISKSHDLDELMDMEPQHLDRLVAEELADLMKKELSLKEKQQERLQKELRNKVIPMKRGGIIRINSNDLKDLDPDAKPEDILKYLYKKFTGKEAEDEDDDNKDRDKFKEDNTGYYI